MERTSKLFGAITFALTLAALPVTASASERRSSPYPGVVHVHRTRGPFDYHVLMIDLTNPRLHFVGTDEAKVLPSPQARRPGHQFHRISTFAEETHADIAINANYYDIGRRLFSTCGLTASNGQVWNSTYQDHRLNCFDSIAFGTNGLTSIFDSSQHDRTGALPEPWMREIVTGSPRLLRDGALVHATFPRHALHRNPRTAIGLSRDRRTLYLLVANGREFAGQGMTCDETANALRSLGAWDALNLDGGGSSALYIRREHGIVSHCSDGSERPVGNHIGIVFRNPPAKTQSETAIAKSVASERTMVSSSRIESKPTVSTPSRTVLFPNVRRPRVRPVAVQQDGRSSWATFAASTAVVGIALVLNRRRRSGEPSQN